MPYALALWLAAAFGIAAMTAHAQDGASSPQVQPIGRVQAAAARSPRVGEELVVEGVATAAMRHSAVVDGASDGSTSEGSRSDEARESRHGWFVQDAGDGDPATSDALFVLGREAPAVGTRLRIRGVVVELDAGRGSLTALRPLSIQALGPGRMPKPVRIAALPTDWESLEGMRIRIAAPLRVAGSHRLQRDGELLVHSGERLRTPTDVVAPGDPARRLAAANLARSLRLDDGSLQERPASIWYLPDGAPRSGSRLRAVEGVLDQRGGGYVLQLTRAPTFKPAARPAAPTVDGDVRIAALNLENFFNGDGRGGGFPTPRGARTAEEFAAQRGRLVATLAMMNPDIAALMELENDGHGPESALMALVDALNRDDAARGRAADWRAVVTTSGLGSDQIRVGMVYRAERVRTMGPAASLVDDLFGQGSRPPLAQSFRAGEGPVFTVAVNHFKSKGCGDAAGPDTDQGDGQGCWNAMRTRSAQRLDAWLRSDPTASGSDLAMIVGDLNAYTMEDPVRSLLAAGWHDAFAGQAMAYSYVFSGQIGRLDHALLSRTMRTRLSGAVEWHSNADEPAEQGFRERPEATGPWRSSDHDPLLIGLGLRRP